MHDWSRIPLTANLIQHRPGGRLPLAGRLLGTAAVNTRLAVANLRRDRAG